MSATDPDKVATLGVPAQPAVADVGVVAGVVQIGGGGAAPAAGTDAVPVPHLDMPAQRGVGEAAVGVLVQCGAGGLAVFPGGGDAVQDPGTLGVLGSCTGSWSSIDAGHGDLHDAADAVTARTRSTGAAAGEITV